MDADILKGKWHQLKGAAKVRWGNLTDDDLKRVEGQAEKLVGVIQERYGYDRQRAHDEVNQFLDRYAEHASNR